MKKLMVIFFIWGFTFGLNAQKLISYSVPEGVTHNNDFSVKVRVPGGEWQELFEYEVLIDSHNVRKASMVYFDFEGTAEVSITYNREKLKSARIRPLAKNIVPLIKSNKLTFTLTKPTDISIEINGDIFQNLHLFANGLEKDKPNPNDTNVIYIKPGLHNFKDGILKVPSNKNLYLEGGAVLKAKIVCDNVNNVQIGGRGILYQGQRGIEITNSSDILVNDVIIINPTHYTVYGGQSKNILIHNLRSFSCKGWSDGIDLMSCTDVMIDSVFMRNSDDCIALYCHRWDYYGDCRNILVQNSTLWADVAHPIMIGTHGNPEPGKSETIENLYFKNIDILNHDEPQIDYQGCMTINVSDENLAKNIMFEDIRVEDFERGQLINLRVCYNKKYAKAPGRGIENVFFKNITYNGNNSNISIVEGYSTERDIKGIVFENLVINGVEMSPKLKIPGYMKYSDFARIYEGLFTETIKYLPGTVAK